MDELERRLKEDAEAIDATVPARLEARIAAAVAAAKPAKPAVSPSSAGARFDFRWWWASTLTGAAAVFAVVIVAVVLRSGAPDDEPAPPVAATDEAAIRPAIPASAEVVAVPLEVRRADFAEPLQTELDALKSDLEKARSAVEDDLRFTF